MAHTPAEHWIAWQQSGFSYRYVTVTFPAITGEREMAANLRLVLAAPDLLAAVVSAAAEFRLSAAVMRPTCAGTAAQFDAAAARLDEVIQRARG